MPTINANMTHFHYYATTGQFRWNLLQDFRSIKISQRLHANHIKRSFQIYPFYPAREKDIDIKIDDIDIENRPRSY